MLKKYFLAYGSSLNNEQMKKICPKATLIGTTFLPNTELVFGGIENEEGYLTLEKREGKFVPVAIWQISIFDEMNLNRYSKCPQFYDKDYREVLILGRKVKAMYYVLPKGYSYVLPSYSYLSVCMEGYRNHLFDTKLLEEAIYRTKEKRKKAEEKQKILQMIKNLS